MYVISPIGSRDFSVDLLKFLAIFLIINSHSDIAYPAFSILATGGAVGDGLFLFCSGYTLFLGKNRRFDNYYKRRINRIYPSVVACVLVLLSIGYYSFSTLTWERFLGGEFIIAIMAYYVFLWFVRQYLYKYVPHTICMVLVITCIAYYFYPYKYETGEHGLYGISTYFRWIPYLGIMLLGAYVGVKRTEIRFNTRLDFVKLAISLIVFYALQFMAKENPKIAPIQIVTVPFLYGITYYSYKCCNARFFRNAYDNHYWRRIIMTISGLCLESYLIQFSVITDKLNYIFPLNLFIIFVLVLISAYVIRCVARFFSQTFQSEDYDWSKVFSLR